MIRPISQLTSSFRADKTINNETGEYKDPMMQWPLRGAAFTNEVGEALRPVIGSYATLSWAPALMYIGADIYDKYKNDQTEYSPDSRRCLKQAIFQGMASIFLPLIAVKTGQGIVSQFGKFTEDKISYNTIEQVSKIAEGFIANGKMHEFSGRDEECKREFINRVNNTLDYANSQKKIHFNSKENVDKYATNTIEDLIALRKKLLNPTAEFEKDKLYSVYKKALKSGQTKSVAVKTVLTKFQKNKVNKGNVIKTLGGFVALGLMIKPIDHFVENILIGKYVGPEIDKIGKKDQENKEA